MKVHCYWFIFPLPLPTQTILVFQEEELKRSRKKWKRSDSSDFDSVAQMSMRLFTIYKKITENPVGQ